MITAILLRKMDFIDLAKEMKPLLLSLLRQSIVERLLCA